MDANEIIPESESGYFERLGAKTEGFLESFFTVWGTYCAKHPWIVLTIGKEI
jgi:Niemann-Pick C1 protein